MVFKKTIFMAALACLILLSVPSPVRSELKAPAPVIVPIRVQSGGEFVTDLKLQDIQLLENGTPQTIDTLFLVDKTSVVRKDGSGEFLPDTSRRFYLLFQLFEYHPKLSNAIRDFFDQGLLPGDSLNIQTPMRNYTLTPEAFAKKRKDVLAKEMDDIVRRDITEGGMAYKSLMSELKQLVRRIGGQNPMSNFEEGSAATMDDFNLEYILNDYRDAMMRLEALRRIDAAKLVRFAQSLKDVPGQKIVFFVYQREFTPEVPPAAMNTLVDNNQDNQQILSDLHELFQVYHRNLSVNTDEIAQAFADASVNFNFLFMDKKPDRIGGMMMREQSEDVFKVFSATARATGGIVDTSQNPEAAIMDALKAAGTYYLLYYTPSNPTPDNTFKTISVGIKGRDYKIACRQGYIAR